MSGIVQTIIAGFGGTSSSSTVYLPSTIYVENEEYFSGTSTASFTISSSGVYSGVGNISVPGGAWLLSGTNSDYDVRLTVIAGSFSGDVTGSWLNLGTTRSWYKSISSGSGSTSGIGTLEIRKTSTGVVQVSSSITITAESYSGPPP